ncbi:MAG: alanine racemase C-terminal domain-containing protein, partial [Thermomicrobiales bacterium]
YRRSLTGRAWAGFQGERLQEIGRVSMDQTIFALTASCLAGHGDVITVVGDGSRGEPTMEELASLADTIPYELLTGLGQRLPVFYYSGGHVVAYNNI